LLTWRQRATGGTGGFVLAQEELIRQLDTANTNYHGLGREVQQLAPQLVKDQSDIRDRLAVVDRFAGEQSDELVRYKDGYDLKIAQVYIDAVIRSIEDIRRYRNSDNFSFPSLSQQEEMTLRNQLRSLEGDLSDKLEDLGIVKFDPPLGPIDSTNPDWIGVRNPEPTQDTSLVNNIAVVEQSGWLYYLTEQDDPKVIRRAVVRVYVLHEGGQTND
jgi:hypothetical protein